MSILSDFEDRLGGAVEGLFAGAFRSPVQPVEIAKALGRAMDDGRMLGVSKVYAPVSYTVAISEHDEEKMLGMFEVLEGELATFLVDHARQRSYTLSGTPVVDFVVHDDLKLGRFRVSADPDFAVAEGPDDLYAPPPVAEPVAAGDAAGALYDHESDEPWGEAEPQGADTDTLTIGETGHGVALRGDSMVIGRLGSCDICLQDANVSRRHAELTRHDDGWHVEDLDSTNGTTVNGEAATGARLTDGDVVEVGLTRLTYHGRGS